MPLFLFSTTKKTMLGTRGNAGAKFQILHVSKPNKTVKRMHQSVIPTLKNNYFLSRAEMEWKEQEKDYDKENIWRPSLQAQQASDRQLCLGQNNGKRCTTKVLSPSWRVASVLTREHSNLNRGHTHFMQILPCCMADSVPHNHTYLTNTGDRCYPAKHSQGHSTGVLFFLTTGISLGYAGSWATLRRREVKIKSIQNVLH